MKLHLYRMRKLMLLLMTHETTNTPSTASVVYIRRQAHLAYTVRGEAFLTAPCPSGDESTIHARVIRAQLVCHMFHISYRYGICLKSIPI
jgi:hypothetical protein